MLSKKFDCAINALKESNSLALKKHLMSMNPSEMGEAALALYNRLLKDSGIKIQQIGHQDLVSRRAEDTNTKKLSEIAEGETIKGVSIVTCCMDRNDNLVKSIESWLAIDVDEIVIVDWSSAIPVSDSLRHIRDDRIKIVRVEGEKRWVLSYAFNLAIRFAKFSKIFKLDADIEVRSSFLERNSFSNDEFVRGYWKKALDEGLESQVYVNGSFGADKQALLRVGGYNEFIRTYGWDDSDLYERLASQGGLKTKFLEFDSLKHLEQEEDERTINQDVIRNNFIGLVPTTEFNNQRNKFIGRNTDQWHPKLLQDYDISYTCEGEWLAKRTTVDRLLPKYFIHHANTYASIHFLWGRYPSLIAKVTDPFALGEFLFSEYSNDIHFNTSSYVLGERECSLVLFDGSKSYREFLSDCIAESSSSGSPVFALSISEEYLHRRIGDHKGFVEVLSVPKKQAEMILSARAFNLTEVPDGFYRALELIELTSTIDAVFAPKLYIDAQHGLGNRLRAIGSAAAVAKAAGRELVIIWEPDHHCDCTFSDLFDYDGEICSRSFVDEALETMSVYNYMEIEPGAEKDKLIELDDRFHLYARSAYVLNSPHSNWDSENDFIKSLKLSNEVNEILGSIDTSERFLAAHVRMEAGKGLDHNTYDSMDNWTKEGHDELHYWREKSHYSHFLRRIDELFEGGDFEKVFLATDMAETYELFSEYYGQKVFFLSREVYDRSAEQIKYALADAVLLSRSEKLLGSTWSSFSELAMRISKSGLKVEMSGNDF